MLSGHFFSSSTLFPLAHVPPCVAARIDLHAHTVVSDGTLTPAQLVELAAASGLAALAVTDHDHTGALAEAREAGARLGVEIVSGIELSVEHPVGGFGGDGRGAGASRPVEVHLLGYLFDEGDAALQAELARFRDVRTARAGRIVERLRALGVDVSVEDVLSEVPAGEGASVGRPHVARALMRKGLVGSIQEAFDLWLGEGRPAHVEKAKLSARQAIALVHAAGGVAVLAHPVTIREEAREALVRELAALGLDGLEVEYPKHAPEERRRLARLASELDLVATGGSDFHGENKPDVRLGTGIGENIAVGADVLDALKRRAAGAARSLR